MTKKTVSLIFYFILTIAIAAGILWLGTLPPGPKNLQVSAIQILCVIVFTVTIVKVVERRK